MGPVRVIQQPATTVQLQAPLPQIVDRTTGYSGRTALRNASVINIAYNAEVRQVPCYTQLWFAITCRCYDHGRSYLYLRENSIESNVSSGHMCGEVCRSMVACVCLPITYAFDALNCVLQGFCPCPSPMACLDNTGYFDEQQDHVTVEYFDRGEAVQA